MSVQNLESALNFIRQKFYSYSGTDGDKSTLSANELGALARKEFPSLCRDPKSEEVLKSVLMDMDMDGDKKLNYKEFVLFLVCLSIVMDEGH
ncbi:protein S100-P [Microcaecilia unicolor]|uniref:Protein S100-A6 n=1 Tax=Microcaecilia unicolor TaxID=1415580 RepID=A0A6P7WZQ6_9AMPH|nr:protein S100-A6 [Microcaecilia unicolor]XP_030043420.1 protein S100-A6 [Microcaecilia unicolor]